MATGFYRKIAVFCATAVLASHAGAMDTNTFLKVARDSVKTLKKAKTQDIDQIIEKQKELIRLGIEGCLEFAEQNPNDARMMQLIVLNALKMQNLTLDEIEKEWVEGDYLKDHGIDVDKYASTDLQLNYRGAIVNPATAIVALREFKKSQDPQLLEQVQSRLAEVIQQFEGMK